MRAVSTLQPVDNGEPGLANEKRFRATALQRCIASVIIPSAALWSAQAWFPAIAGSDGGLELLIAGARAGVADFD